MNFAEMSSKKGLTLLEMTPSDFDTFAPQLGLTFYEHFQRFRKRINESRGKQCALFIFLSKNAIIFILEK